MWWNIIKSSREEAYEEFVREFGPEVELDSLTVNPYEDEKQVQIDSSGSEWVVNYAILSSGEEQFTFESMSKYLKASFQIFVEGMFETEYPERYQELLEMARKELRPSGGWEQDTFELVDKYLKVSRNIMELLRSRIIGADMDDTVRTSVVLPVSHPGYVRMPSERVIPKIDAAGPTKSDIVFAITELMVDRMMREIHIFRSQLTQGRVNARMGRGRPRLSNGFRDALTELYYEVLSTANSGGRKPNMVFNSAADNATRNLIDYLKVVAEVYLEE